MNRWTALAAYLEGFARSAMYSLNLRMPSLEFVEHDFMLRARSGIWHLAWEGGLMPCGNQSCRRGGYELDRGIREMLQAGVFEEKVKLFCRGDEGSPQGRRIGPRCQRSIEATVTLRFKAPAADALTP